jgi:hypothetical protein
VEDLLLRVKGFPAAVVLDLILQLGQDARSRPPRSTSGAVGETPTPRR